MTDGGLSLAGVRRPVEGTYTLLVELREDAVVEVGALGEHAFGPGGFARVERHRELAAGEREARHWHVDYLLGHPDAVIREAVRSPGVDVECAVARRLPAGPVEGFGASDCDCPSHLAALEGETETTVATVEEAHAAARDASE